MEAILSWILTNWPTIGIVIVLLVITWFVALYYAKVEKTIVKVDNLPCKSHELEINKIGNIAQLVNSANERVTEISKWIMHNDDAMIETLTKKCSPRVMTATGRELFKRSGAENSLKENINRLISEIDAKHPKTPYDVEESAFSVLLNNLNNSMFDSIKNFIYYEPEVITLKDENGVNVDVRISLSIIVRLMSIELRDAYLQKHSELIPSKK